MGGWFAETVAVTATLAALGLLAGRSRRVPAEARHALWAVVLVRFLLPPTVAWPWAAGRQPFPPPGVVRVSADPAAPPVEPAVPAAPVAPAAGPIVPVDPPELPTDPFHHDAPPAEPGPAPTPPVAAVAPRPISVPVPAAVTFRSHPSPWIWLGLLAWSGGSVAVAARGAGRVVRFRRALRRAAPAPDWLRDEIAAVGARLGVRPPSAEVLDGAGGPALWCLGRPRLVLPDGLDRMPAGSRAALLAHELAHLARGDHWAARLDLLAGLAWWWNPVCRLARRRLRAEAEAACDARVVRAYPEHRLAYAEALLSVSERLSRRVPPWPAVGLGAAGAARNLEARLTMILRDPIRSPSRWLPAVALALLALTLPSWTRGQQPTQPADPPPVEPTGANPPAAADAVLPADRPAPTEAPPPAAPTVAQPGGAEAPESSSRPAGDRATDQLPPAARTRLLQIRRDAQAAAVARAQARHDLVAALVAGRDKLRQSNAITAKEFLQGEAELKIAAAELDGEKARLAEAELILDPHQTDAVAPTQPTAAARPAGAPGGDQPTPNRVRRTAATADPDPSDDHPHPPATLADWRDQAEMAVLQLEGKQAERQLAEAKVALAKVPLNNAEKLFKKGVVSDSEVAIFKARVQQAEDEARVKGVEVRQAELRLKQALRRAESEEARLRRSAEVARAEVDRLRPLLNEGRTLRREFDAARDRLDDLMFQLDPDRKPEPR